MTHYIRNVPVVLGSSGKHVRTAASTVTAVCDWQVRKNVLKSYNQVLRLTANFSPPFEGKAV